MNSKEWYFEVESNCWVSMDVTIVATGMGMSSLAIIVKSYLPDMNLIFGSRLDRMAPIVCIHGRSNSRLKTTEISVATKEISN